MTSVIFHINDLDIDSYLIKLGEYRQLLKAMHFDRLIIIDNTTYRIVKNYYVHNDSDLEFLCFETLQECLDTLSITTHHYAFLEIRDFFVDTSIQNQLLSNYQHRPSSENPIYVFGPDFAAMSIMPENSGDWITIETSQHYPLYAKHAASIVCYHRLIQLT